MLKKILPNSKYIFFSFLTSSSSSSTYNDETIPQINFIPFPSGKHFHPITQFSLVYKIIIKTLVSVYVSELPTVYVSEIPHHTHSHNFHRNTGKHFISIFSRLFIHVFIPFSFYCPNLSKYNEKFIYETNEHKHRTPKTVWPHSIPVCYRSVTHFLYKIRENFFLFAMTRLCQRGMKIFCTEFCVGGWDF